MNIEQVLKQAAPVMPVLVIERIEDAVPLAEALVSAGVTVLEVTLRTPCALAAIAKISENVPGACVGVGTVTLPGHFADARSAGAKFAVSPGIGENLIESAKEAGMPFLPGVATASDVILAMAYGLTSLKFFPAVEAGGIRMLKALSGPFEEIVFCPTGGIHGGNYQDFLALPNVACVGGSFLAPQALVEAKSWKELTRHAARFARVKEEGA